MFSTDYKVTLVVSRESGGCSGVQGQGLSTAIKALHGCLVGGGGGFWQAPGVVIMGEQWPYVW